MSRELEPKQLLPLVSERSLLQETLLRTLHLTSPVSPPIVIANERHGELVREQLAEIDVQPRAIVLEPQGRNTAPAVAIGALLAQSRAAHGEDPILLVLPADHVVLDPAAFGAAVEVALEGVTAGKLVTFGIVPDRAETGYGYLRKGESRGTWSLLDAFVEKPDAETARSYVQSGQYLWNSGMFLFGAGAYIEELERLEPRMLERCRAALAAAESDAEVIRLGAAFLDSPSNSIDYAVMERTRHAAVVPLDAGWSDVGSWPALHAVVEKDAQGNALRGDVVALGCTNSYVSSSARLVAVIGLDAVVVVETSDAVLVMPAAEAQRVKQIVDALKARERPETHAVTRSSAHAKAAKRGPRKTPRRA